jgi:hypothetical protein
VALATHGNGIYSARLFDKTDILKLNDLNSFDFKIYPNPAKSKITVEIPKGQNVNKLIVFDELGRIVIENSNIKLSGESTELDLQFLMNGIYYIQLNFESGVKKSNIFYKD